MPKSLQSQIASCIALGSLAITSPAPAQPIPDATLPVNSVVTTKGNISTITSGTRAGRNLFHSFREFSIATGSTAYFNNALDIQNIISRVTGGSSSNIDGVIKANGEANLFLINPNGIIFGPHASLNIGGSFLASTANSLKFADGTEFSATTPETTPLLTISVPIGLQFGSNPERILFQALGTTDSNGYPVGGLQLMSGQTLALVGGDINFDNGTLQAPGGRVELGGLAGAGTVGLNVDAGLLKLSFPNDVARADVSLTNGSQVNVQAGGGGSIFVNAKNLSLAGDSQLMAGIASGLGSVNSQAGDIDINVTKAITLNSGSFISNTVGNPIYYIAGNLIYLVPNGAGKGGDINITTGSLSGTNGASLNTTTYGQGDAGSVKINANGPVSFDNSSASSQVNPGATGNGGDVSVTAGSLSVANGATLDVSTFGNGNAGGVKINASGSVSFDNSSASSLVSPGGIGNSGGISIDTETLTVAHSSELNSSTTMDGQGRAGDITIKARDSVLFDGGFAFSRLEKGGIGRGGDIRITTDGSVSVTGIPSDTVNSRIGQLVTTTFGQGDAGNITIKAGQNVSINGRGSDLYTLVARDKGVGNAGNITIDSRSLSVLNGARLVSTTENQGNAGNVTINVNGPVSFDNNSLATSSVSPGAIMGNGGDINVTAGSLSLTNGAGLTADTSEQGNAGNVTINVPNGPVFFDNSNALSTVNQSARGKGGNINVMGGSLSLTNGAQLSASTSGNGAAGSIAINVSGSVSFNGVDRLGNASGAFSSSKGSGSAGNLDVTASSIRLDNKSSLDANTVAGQGNITLHSGNLLLRHGSNITTNASGTEPGGNIFINTDILVAFPTEDSDISANAFKGNGGQVKINAAGIFGIQPQPVDTPRSDITASSTGGGINGVVNLNTLNVDPSRGLVALPVILADTSKQIAQGCAAGNGTTGSRFVVTGRGGLPSNPSEPLSSEAVWSDTRFVAATGKPQRSQQVSAPQSSASAEVAFVPATGWVFDGKGDVTLTAAVPSERLQVPWLTPASCHAQ